METYPFCKKSHRARILKEIARFPPFGFAIAEMSSNSNEDISVLPEDSPCPDSDRERSRVRGAQVSNFSASFSIFCVLMFSV